MPLYSALKDFEPEIFREVLFSFHTGIAQGKTMGDLRQAVFPRVMEVYRRRTPYAEDGPIIDATRVIMEQIAALYRINPDLCYAYLFPEGSIVRDLGSHFSADLARRELEAMAAVIKSGAAGKARPPNESAVGGHLEQIYSSLGETYGDDLAFLVNPATPGVDKRRVCEMAFDFYDRVTQLPPTQAGPLLRFLMAEQ